MRAIYNLQNLIVSCRGIKHFSSVLFLGFSFHLFGGEDPYPIRAIDLIPELADPNVTPVNLLDHIPLIEQRADQNKYIYKLVGPAKTFQKVKGKWVLLNSARQIANPLQFIVMPDHWVQLHKDPAGRWWIEGIRLKGSGNFEARKVCAFEADIDSGWVPAKVDELTS